MLDLDLSLPIEVQEAYRLPFHVTVKGHAVVYAPHCPWAWRASGQIRRSHYVLWVVGREIPPGHIVHHRDEHRLNDHPINLEVIPGGKHTALHWQADSTLRRQRISAALMGHPVSEFARQKSAEINRGNTNASGKRTGERLKNIRQAVIERERRRYEAETELRTKVKEMYAHSGLSTHKIARALGITKDRVCRLLKA